MAEAVEQRSSELAAGASGVHESLRSQAERIRAVDFRQAFLDHAVEPASSELRAASAEFSALLERVRAVNEELTRTTNALATLARKIETAASAST